MNKRFGRFQSSMGKVLTGPAITKTSMFAPGAFFLLLGVLAFVAPKFLGLVIALFFVFVGVLFCVLAWRFMQLKKKFEGTLKDLSQRVSVQTYHYSEGEDPFSFVEEVDDKKIILH